MTFVLVYIDGDFLIEKHERRGIHQSSKNLQQVTDREPQPHSPSVDELWFLIFPTECKSGEHDSMDRGFSI